MEIDERKLREILTEQREDFKRHVGLLVEEVDSKFALVQEGFHGLADKVDQLHHEITGIRQELEQVRMLLFRKADVERLEVLEQRVAAIEKRLLQK